jgi:hypothetical protein
MAQWKRDEVEELLEAKMRETAARLRVKGHKPGIENLAADLAPFVIALMSDSRRREIGGVLKTLEGLEPKGGERMLANELKSALSERRLGLKRMAATLWKFAERQLR